MFRLDTIGAYAIGIALTLMMLVIFNKSHQSASTDLTFPDGFLIGTASSSYQVEGGWNISGKGESIWDHLVHNSPEKVEDRSTADVSCDSFHKFREDVRMMKDIGVNHYRFSLSWSRILPTGYKDNVSKEGVQYYHSMLDELEKHDIIPFVTLYHWDHPQSLERLGGWTNELMAEFFADYAEVVFKEFGHRIKYIATLNEPYIFCIHGYRTTLFAPSLNLSGWGEYACMHNMLKAHALAYHIYNDHYRKSQKGWIGIVLPCFQHYSKSPSDSVSGDLAFEFQCGWTAHPIFSADGDYSEVMKKMLEERSRLEGRRKSKLPTFSKEWIELIRGSSDYFGLNHYTAYLVEPISQSKVENPFDINYDNGLVYSIKETWPTSQSDWLRIVPEGLREILIKIKERYNNPPVFIMENGVSDPNIVNDTIRIKYLHDYMRQVLIAMKEDNCNVKAYTIWSFLDSFEWNRGFKDNFGLVSVDFNDPSRKRTPKKSVSWLKSVLQTRALQDVSF